MTTIAKRIILAAVWTCGLVVATWELAGSANVLQEEECEGTIFLCDYNCIGEYWICRDGDCRRACLIQEWVHFDWTPPPPTADDFCADLCGSNHDCYMECMFGDAIATESLAN